MKQPDDGRTKNFLTAESSVFKKFPHENELSFFCEEPAKSAMHFLYKLIRYPYNHMKPAVRYC